MDSAAQPDQPAPRRIADRYDVISVLGEGSSARTLLCTDPRENRRVAVKELHFARLGDWKYLELFEREARMLARLHHPGIPRIYDYFEGEGGAATFYIVQEFIEGLSLQQRMDSGPMLGQKEVSELTLGLLDVLDYLHGRAPPVIHRDIKPSNVILRNDGGPVLIDFGGVNLGWRPPDAPGTTIVGTFGYMPPEQFVGQGGPASDFYSLGATLLHLVTGRAPGEFSFDSGRIEVPADLPVDPSLTRLIEALLRPAPRDRPRTAEAARRLLVDQPVEHTVSLVRSGAAIPAPPRAASAPVYSRLGAFGEPRYVDMGAPPRDPKGELRDVYRNLIHPLFPARRAWSDVEHVLWAGFFGLGAAVTLGATAGLYAMGTRRRKAEFDSLFVNGIFTPGVIRSVTTAGSAIYVTVKYEFEVAGLVYTGFSRLAQEMNRYWSSGDSVGVLYDAGDPGRSCIVYR